MGATFIISFDCEGKWGFADHSINYERDFLTNENINKAYKRIIDILNKYGIKGTFGFVGAFTLSVDEYHENRAWFANKTETVQKWLQLFKKDMERGDFEGWFNPEPIKIVDQENIHEIGSHGFTHIPLGESLISRANFLEEMHLIKQTSHFKARERMTFIYPRNIIGYTDELAKAGFIGYRDRIYSYGSGKTIIRMLMKLKNYSSELNLIKRAQPHAKPGNLIKIPSGFILNYRNGLKKEIPLGLTIKRWEHIILDAVRNNKVVHLWSHPHNFITGDNMYELLEGVLRMVNRFKKTGMLQNVTQKEYAELLAIKKG